ncbi:MAG TPA: hypothetical protein P5572_17305 [Phycisphaerae bacterium]|nr:hypothetical protein [Phycisphaerales bacterium]HRX86786.1 hypothetical protein [Phycisphaerae bacterium]
MKLTSSIAIAVVVTLASAAHGQLIGSTSDAQAVWNTASAGTMSLRAPGNLVSLGRQDYRSAHSLTIARSRFGPTITETAPTGPTPEQQVKIDVIQTTFDNLNAALLVLLNAVRTSGGLPPTTGTGTDLSGLLGHITNGG